MERLFQLIAVALTAMPCAFAQSDGGPESRAVIEKRKAHHARMKDCAQKAGDRTGEERKKFISACLAR